MDTVYLTENAYRDIVLETGVHPTTETGGILLGHTDGEDWFIVEVLDPGPRSVRSATYFEYNHSYATHLAGKVARRYQSPPQLIGLWHRHPGSLDTFSSTDDETHREYLHLLRGAFVSMLVNIDPDFRTTFYRVEAGRRSPRYSQLRSAVGDEHFPSSLLKRMDARDVAAKLRRPSYREPPPVRRQPDAAPFPPIPPLQQPPEPMRIEYLQPLPPARQAPPAEEAEPRPGLLRQLGNAVSQFINPPEGEAEEARANPYRPYRGEEAEAPPAPRRASAEQTNLLDMMEAEFDYLDERGDIFQYHVSPQEPGFRVFVNLLMVPTRPPYPSRVEFTFYYRQGLPVVAIEGREQPYQPGCVRRYYTQYDVPPLPPEPRARDTDRIVPLNPLAGQESRHEGPSSDRPRP